MEVNRRWPFGWGVSVYTSAFVGRMLELRGHVGLRVCLDGLAAHNPVAVRCAQTELSDPMACSLAAMKRRRLLDVYLVTRRYAEIADD